MLVKTGDKYISFLFQGDDPFFEIGYKVLEQEKLAQILPYTRKQQNGKEKLIFSAEDENLVKLSDIIVKLDENDIIDLLYELVYIGKKIEESGFLKKQCIWCDYDCIYYDMENRCIRLAILPITGELRYADNFGWYDSFEITMVKIAEHLPEKKLSQIKKICVILRAGKMSDDEALEEIDRLGCRVSGVLSDDSESNKVALNLLYSGKKGRLEFVIKDDDFTIGRSGDMAEGVIPVDFSRAVSRKHCIITKLNNKYFVQDLKSANHTLVNGIMIPPYEIMELENNDILSVADIEFRVRKLLYER
jgi:hypothetical protein